jgi:cytoskeletal protein CcmA (bactofilin family)
MPSTYTLNNGIELIGTGEQSGTWGDTTNTNLGLLDVALDGQVTVALASAGSSGSPNSLPITDGTASNGRNRMVVFSDSGDLGATAYVQLTPNDAEKIIYIRNSLSGSRSVILFQGTYNASNDYEVPAGTTAVVYFDGAGAGAVAANVFNNAHFDALNVVGAASIGSLVIAGTAVTATAAELNLLDGSIAGTVVNSKAVIYGAAGQVEATTVEFDNLSGTGAVSVTNILDEDNMASDSATALATQQSIKAYVDAQVGTVDTLAEILAIGNTTGATDIAVDSAQKVQFRDAAIYINSSVDGQLDIVADTEIQIAATTVDLNGNLDVSGTLGVTGVLTATSLDISGDIDVDGTTNLDVVDIDGAVDMASTLLVTGVLTTTAATVSNGGGQFNGAINVGVDDTGYDVKFFGATAGKYMLWDESADTLEVSGTVAAGAGTALLPSITTTGDLNTGMWFPAADTIAFSEGGVEALRIDSSGNVGIGTSSSTVWNGASGTKLLVGGASNTITSLQSSSTAINQGGIFEAYSTAVTSGSAALGSIAFLRENTSTAAARSYTSFFTNDGGTVGEKMRIDSSGNVGIGSTTANGRFSVTPSSNPTSLATSTTITLNESTNNAAYQLRMAYSFLSSVYTGVIDAVQNSLGAPLALNPTGGNVGIGTSSPATKLEVASPAATAAVLRISSNKTGTGAGDKSRLEFYSADNSGTAYETGYMVYDRADTTGTASYVAWASRVAGTVAERMRISSIGDLLVNTTSNLGSARFVVEQDTTTANPMVVSRLFNIILPQLVDCWFGSNIAVCNLLCYLLRLPPKD